MSAGLVQTYRYAEASTVERGAQGARLLLATSSPGDTHGLAEAVFTREDLRSSRMRTKRLARRERVTSVIAC